MANYKMIISYDGTRYKGWQILGNSDMTIQGKLTHVLSTLAGAPVEVIGSGRTDAGVHALGQVANVHMTWNGTNEELLQKINGFLPEDIAVLSVEEVEERFHSRYHATAKTYRYRIYTSVVPDVFARRYVYTYLDAPLDLAAMRKAAQILVGTHDFMAFCGNRRMKKSTVRTIYSIHMKEQDGEVILDYCGDGFLQNMVRILTGTLIEVGTGRIPVSAMEEILKSRDRAKAGYTAPPQGLCLMKVQYDFSE